MRVMQWVAGALASVAMMAAAMPARAAIDAGSAEKIRKLDIMLMVTSLRCRHTPDGFQDEYERFTSAHLPELNEAARSLEGALRFRHGDSGAKRELDRMSVMMANSYGLGHPTLGCRELRNEARGLADDTTPGALALAADRLLPVRSEVQLAAKH